MKTETSTVQLSDATLRRDNRVLWQDLSLSVAAGEFIAILGPNGAGKTSLLKVLLGVLPLSEGDAQVLGNTVKRGNTHIGYIPQQKSHDPDLPLRGRDFVELGLTGYRYGFSRPRNTAAQVTEALVAVGAETYADLPLGVLSGGEQQRLRVAQALIGKPEILLCDEPLLSLDITSQQLVTQQINAYRQDHKASVLFVTHEINPILPYVDRILYFANGQWVVDKPRNVLQSKTLSKLYGTDVEVHKFKDRVIVLAENVEGVTGGHHHGGEA